MIGNVTGTVTLTLATVPATRTGPLTLGTLVTASISGPLAEQDWTFTGTAGQLVALDTGTITATGKTGCWSARPPG